MERNFKPTIVYQLNQRELLELRNVPKNFVWLDLSSINKNALTLTQNFQHVIIKIFVNLYFKIKIFFFFFYIIILNLI